MKCISCEKNITWEEMYEVFEDIFYCDSCCDKWNLPKNNPNYDYENENY